MCTLIAFHRVWSDAPIVVAANRDEEYARRSLPPRWAYAAGWFSEFIARIIRMKRSPYVTRYGVGLVLRPTNYSSAKAARELGWELRMPVHEAMRLALEWHQQRDAEKLRAPL